MAGIIGWKVWSMSSAETQMACFIEKRIQFKVTPVWRLFAEEEYHKMGGFDVIANQNSNSKKWFVTKIVKLEIKSVLVLLYFLGFFWWSFDVYWKFGGGGIWILCGFVNAYLMFLFSF